MIDDVILVVGKGQIGYCRQEVVEKYHFQKIRKIVEGGAERYHSVWAALRLLEQEKMKEGYIFIHDGARPFVNEEILDRAYEEGLFDRVFTTNLIYREPELLARPWYTEVSMSKYIAHIINILNHDMSISGLLSPSQRIHQLLERHERELQGKKD